MNEGLIRSGCSRLTTAVRKEKGELQPWDPVQDQRQSLALLPGITPGYREQVSNISTAIQTQPSFLLGFRKTHLRETSSARLPGVCCTCGVSTQRMVLCAQEKPPRAGPVPWLWRSQAVWA